MSAVTVTLSHICAGGNHLTFTVSGDVTHRKVLDLSVLSEPLADEDPFLIALVKLVKRGRTNAQARTLLQAGVTVVV